MHCQAMYVQLPPREPGVTGQLTMAWEDPGGNWHPHGEFRLSDPPDLEAMGLQVMRAWISLARRNLDGP